jgi:hypothetical protein
MNTVLSGQAGGEGPTSKDTKVKARPRSGEGPTSKDTKVEVSAKKWATAKGAQAKVPELPRVMEDTEDGPAILMAFFNLAGESPKWRTGWLGERRIRIRRRRMVEGKERHRSASEGEGPRGSQTDEGNPHANRTRARASGVTWVHESGRCDSRRPQRGGVSKTIPGSGRFVIRLGGDKRSPEKEETSDWMKLRWSVRIPRGPALKCGSKASRSVAWSS